MGRAANSPAAPGAQAIRDAVAAEATAQQTINAAIAAILKGSE